MYDYDKQRAEIYTESGLTMFVAIRDHARRILAKSGSATMLKLISGARGGDSWTMLACVDHLVERGELAEIPQGQYVVGQNRIFTVASTDWMT